jgi:hypothetical protein
MLIDHYDVRLFVAIDIRDKHRVANLQALIDLLCLESGEFGSE